MILVTDLHLKLFSFQYQIHVTDNYFLGMDKELLIPFLWKCTYGKCSIDQRGFIHLVMGGTFIFYREIPVNINK